MGTLVERPNSGGLFDAETLLGQGFFYTTTRYYPETGQRSSLKNLISFLGLRTAQTAQAKTEPGYYGTKFLA
jgi:hypothetical protein